MVPRWQRSIGGGSLVAVGLLIGCSSGSSWNSGGGDGGSAAPMTTASARSGSSSGAPSTSSSGTGFDSGLTGDDGGDEASFNSNGTTVVISGADGGACQMCSSDSECQVSCLGMTLMPGYLWCCQSNVCIMWGAKTCPMPVGGGSGGGSGGGGTCGGAMQPCCSMDPACQMGLMCDQQSGTCQ